jgi:hypothetical protein
LIALAFPILLGGAVSDEDANARCEISTGDSTWTGPCFTEREGPHDVTLGWLPGHRFPFGWSGIFLTSTDGEVWRLRVHVSFGDDRFLGVVRRSRSEPDCWIGEGYKICAREGR